MGKLIWNPLWCDGFGWFVRPRLTTDIIILAQPLLPISQVLDRYVPYRKQLRPQVLIACPSSQSASGNSSFDLLLFRFPIASGLQLQVRLQVWNQGAEWSSLPVIEIWGQSLSTNRSKLPTWNSTWTWSWISKVELSCQCHGIFCHEVIMDPPRAQPHSSWHFQVKF